MIGYLLGLIAGAASPTQASVNLKIREDLRSAYTTTLVNFISAGVILAIITAAVDGNLQLPLGVIAEQPFWIWLGGPCGTAIVLLNVICLPKLGSAKNVMLICFGQIMTGLITDHYGLFGSLQIPMSVKRLIGAVLVIAGIALVNEITLRRKSGDGDDINTTFSKHDGGSVIIYALLAIFCGFACAAQVAINGTLTQYAGTPLKATLISMIAGFIATAIICLVIIALKGTTGLYDGGDGHGPIRINQWLPAGGALAILIVGSNAIAAPMLGTGVVTILNLVGMMAAGLLIDAVGFLGIEKQPVTIPKITGMLFMLLGAALITF